MVLDITAKRVKSGASTMTLIGKGLEPVNEADEPIDRRMVARRESRTARSSRWRPSPLGWWFLVILGFDALILLIASGVRSSGSDAAGNGLANAYQEVFVEVGAVLVGILALLFLIIRHRGIRIGLFVLLVLLTLMLPMLLS